MAKVFISYSTEDVAFVDKLVEDLQERSVGVWYARYEIRVGDSIVTKINEGLSTTDWLLLVMSHSAVRSPWVQLELNAAVALTVQRDAYILVARIDSAPIPPILLDRKYADFSADYERGLAELLAVVAPGTASLPPQGQIAWGKMSAIFGGLLLVKWSDAQARNTYLADVLDSLKSDWHMGDDVFEHYIQACVDAERLLFVTEYVKQIPTVDVNDPRLHAVFRWLLESQTRI